MSADPPGLIRVSRIVPAEAAAIFDLLAHPDQHRLIDGSNTLRAPTADRPTRLVLGARFGMKMRLGVPYRITSTVIEFDEPHVIAWRHPGRHVWRYLLEPIDGDSSATLVTEECDLRPSPLWLLLQACRVPKRNRAAIEATLDRLVDRFS